MNIVPCLRCASLALALAAGTGLSATAADSLPNVILIVADVAEDPGETRNVAAAHPDVVKRLTAAADIARRDLGDSLQEVTGSGLRKPGFDDSSSSQ